MPSRHRHLGNGAGPGTDAVAPSYFRRTHPGKRVLADWWNRPAPEKRGPAPPCPALPPPRSQKGAQGRRVYSQCLCVKEDFLGLRDHVAFSGLKVNKWYFVFTNLEAGCQTGSMYCKKRKAPLRAVPPTGSAGNGSFNVAGLCWKPELTIIDSTQSLLKGSSLN